MSTLRRRGVALTAVVAAVGWWILTAWIARDVRPWAIAWAGTFVATGLLISYIAAWLVVGVRAKNCRVAAFKAATVTLLLPVLLLILEGPAAIGAVDYAIVWKYLFDEVQDPRSTFLEDRDLVFRRPPNLSWSGRPRSDMARVFNLPIRAPSRLSFTTDSHGFRNPPNLNRADALLLGDSYIEGDYASDEDTVAAELARLTGRTVANLGVSGYGTLQELIVLEQHLPRLSPELVAWFFFEGNDLYNDQDFENSRSYYIDPKNPVGDERPKALNRPLRILTWKAFTAASFTVNAFELFRVAAHLLIPKTIATFGWFRDDKGQAHRMYFFDYGTLQLRDYERERFETTKTAFLKGAALARQRGARVVLFFIPMKFRVYGDKCRFPANSPCLRWKPWDLARHFTQFCAEARLECVDLTVPMRAAAARGELLYAPEDSHWNKEGHAFVARQVLQAWKPR